MAVVTTGLLACAHDEPAKTASNADTSAAATTITITATSTPTNGESTAGGAPAQQGQSATLANAGPNPMPTDSPLLSNEQILEVTHTADEGEIQQARLAQSKSKSERVQSLAAMMLRDHKAAEKKADALAVKDNLTRQASPTSESLKTDAEGFTQALKAEVGPGFDRQYVETQIHEHQAVLDTIDTTLMPSASNPDVKAYLEDVRDAVATHLEHARKLELELNKQPQKQAQN
jgi:putative membrane protein